MFLVIIMVFLVLPIYSVCIGIQFFFLQLILNVFIVFLLTIVYADSTLKPGPGAHNTAKTDVVSRKAPSYSLGVRHSEYLCPLIIDVTD